jgi:mannose-6-phosphate isomerase-like protein (cupin superfamily)
MPRMSSPTPRASRPAARGTAVTDGAALTFETVAAFDDAAPPLRVRPDEATLLRVISGGVRLTVGDVERLLATGEEAIVRAGEAHRIAGVAGEARLVMGFRAAPLR